MRSNFLREEYAILNIIIAIKLKKIIPIVSGTKTPFVSTKTILEAIVVFASFIENASISIS